MDDAGVRKKALAKEMEEKTAAFDARLEKETQDRISQIRGKMEEELQQELRQQKEDAKAVMRGWKRPMKPGMRSMHRLSLKA